MTRALSFLRQGSLLVQTSGRQLQLWDWQRGLNLGSLSGHAMAVTALALSPDGQQLASLGSGGQLRLWSTRTGRSGQPADTGQADARVLAYAADGQLLAVGGGQTTAVFNLGTGQGLHLLPSGPNAALQFSPDGQLLAVQGPTGWRLWSMATGRPTAHLTANAQGVPVALSPSLKQALRSDGRHISLVALPDDIVVARTASVGVTQAVFSDDGQHVAWVQADGRALRWQLQGGVPQMLAPAVATGAGSPDEPPPVLAFSADGTVLAIAGADGVLRLWDPEGRPQGRLAATGEAVQNLAFSPDGSVLALSRADDTATLLDLASGLPQAVRGRPGSPPPGAAAAAGTAGTSGTAAAGGPRRGLAFSPDGRTLATAVGGQLRLVNRANGAVTFTLGAAQAVDLRYSRDGAWLFVLEAEQLQVWDLAMRYKLQTLPLSRDVNVERGLALDASGQQLLLWADGGEPRRVQLEARAISHQGLGAAQRRPVPGMPPRLAAGQRWAASLSPDGRWLALQLDARATAVHDMASGRELLRVALAAPGSPDSPGSAGIAVGAQWQFSPDGSVLMAWGAGLPGQAVLRWALPDGAPLPALRGHQGQVRSVAASADGRWLASTADDRTVRLWSATDGSFKALFKLLGEQGWVALDDGGRFDASSPDAEAGLLLRTGPGPADSAPLGAARADFHRPGLLKQALATTPPPQPETPAATAATAATAAPAAQPARASPTPRTP